MSVYTSIDDRLLQAFLTRYDLGEARAFAPIAAGITNSNYLLDTEHGEFVLTLYEHHSDDELDFLLGLQAYLAEQGLRCAAPVRDRRGDLYSTLKQRPAAIIQRLPGDVVASPGTTHCEQVGAELARFHLLGLDFPGRRPNPRGLDWMLAARDMLGDVLDAAQDRLIDATLRDYRAANRLELPGGAIHADLFHDNALFVDDRLGGIFDFDYACGDSFAFDLAVLINDWCIDGGGELDRARLGAALQGYVRERPLQDDELAQLPLLLQVTALRFWLSRLYDQAFPQSGELTFIKSPDAFWRLLELRRERASTVAELLRDCIAPG